MAVRSPTEKSDSSGLPIDALVNQFDSVLSEVANAPAEEKIEKCVQVLGERQDIPEVGYRQPSCWFQNVCSFWTFCQKVTCCGNHYYYSARSDEGTVILKAKTTLRAPKAEDNKLTNALFFVDLYNTYGQGIVPAWKAAIAYMEKGGFSPDQVSYWKEWDPRSDAKLLPHKVKFFRRLIDEEFSKLATDELTNAIFFLELEKSYGDYLMPAWKEVIAYMEQGGFPPAQIEYWKHFDTRSDAKLPPQKAEFFKGLIEVAYSALHEVRHEVMKQQIRDGITQRRESQMTREKSTEEYHTPTGSPPHQCGEVIIGDIRVKFNQEKIVSDILEMTEATKEEARLIAYEVENALVFPCTLEQIWEEVKNKVIKHNIQVKESAIGADLQGIRKAMERDFYLSSQQTGFLFEFITEIRRNKSRSRQYFKKTNQEIIGLNPTEPFDISHIA